MKFNKKSSLVIIILFTSLLISCQPRVTQHGNFFNLKKIELIKKTKLNKSEILEIFGNPSTKSTFSDDVWYYITLTQYEKAYFSIKNTKNKVLLITFDKNQLVKKYKVLTEEDSIEINISNPTRSDSSKDDMNLIQEFFSIFSRRLNAYNN